MTRDTLRVMARNRWPVVLGETGAHGEIGYPYIREIKAVYASPEELRRGYPAERLAVVVGDRCGHSFTEVRAEQLRLPTAKEAAEICLDRTAGAVAAMCAEIDRLRGKEVSL